MSGGFKFYHTAATPQAPKVVARKCIVCGTTKPEGNMKPFLLKGDHLNLWTNNYFHAKKAKILGFFAKIRYTLNPYACVEHFQAMSSLIAASIAAKNDKRFSCKELIIPGEEPPSISDITQRKPSPPPDEPQEPRTEKEVTDAIMSILHKAKNEMAKEEQKIKQLKKITRKVMGVDTFYEQERVARKKRRKLRRKEKEEKRKEKEEKRKKKSSEDGNDADSDNSDVIDVEAVDSSSSSGDDELTDSEDEASDIEIVSVGGAAAAVAPSGSAPSRAPPLLTNPTTRPGPKREFIFFPHKRSATGRPYVIGHPSSLRRGFEIRRPLSAPRLARVPARLTPSAGTGRKYDRPSWVAANPGQLTLASVLQKFWDDEIPDTESLLSSSPPKKTVKIHRPPPFGRTVIPGTSTKFVPASAVLPSLAASPPPSLSPNSARTTALRPSIRSSAFLKYNPPLSPSRIIVSSEETVETTNHIDDEREEEEEESDTIVLSSSSSSSSEESDVEVCDHSGERPPVEGLKIEGEVEVKSVGTRSRLSTITTSSDGLEPVMSSGDEDVEIDVETVDEEGEKGDERKRERRKKRDSVATAHPTATTDRHSTGAHRSSRRKQRHTIRHTIHSTTSGGQLVCYRPESAKSKIIVQPPSAVVKPPTKLLSTGQYSMKDLLKAEARAVAVQPARIDTTGLLGAIRPRPTDMPRLTCQAREKRISEWSRLERVVELKLAEQQAQILEEKKKKQMEMIDPEVMADCPPPLLDPVPVEEMEDGFPAALVDSLADGQSIGPGKVLRLRFNKKEEEVDVSKLKVLDPSTRPQGVVRTEVVESLVDAPPYSDVVVVDEDDVDEMTMTMAALERREKRNKIKDRNAGPQVTNPLLIISKKEIMEKLSEGAPPPTPIIGIPDKEEFAARRDMYEKKRDATVVRAGLRFGRLKYAREAWMREKLMKLNGEKMERRKEGEEDEEEEDDQEDEALVAEMVEIVKKVKEEKKKKNRGEEREEKGKRRRKKDEDDEGPILVLSDIDFEDIDSEEEEKEGEAECEMDEDKWKKKKEDEEVEDDEEEEGDTQMRRKSNRLRLKRKALPKSERKLIWKTSDDEDEPTPEAPVLPVKRKRGRPRKNPLDYIPPPMKKKRVGKKSMTQMEKDVLSRMLPPDEEDNKEELRMDELMEEEPKKEEKRMGKSRGGDKSYSENEDDDSQVAAVVEDIVEEVERNEEKGEEEFDDPPSPLEKQQPKAAGDEPILASRRKKMPWSWKQKLENEAHTEMGGRLCNYCMKHQKRFVWIVNSPVALMDHARTHCVETLMCPNKECTYMNSQRSRISQHVSYVHKKWGMPIDLAEVYPSMRKSLMMRLRHCFPDMPNVSVCRLCRVAVKPESDHLRWHAQTHMQTQVFECSRNICLQKFSSEEDCLEHIQKSNCRGSVVNGMTEEMEEALDDLVEQCFENKECQQPEKRLAHAKLAEGASDDEVHSDTPSTSTAKPASQHIEEEEESGTSP